MGYRTGNNYDGAAEADRRAAWDNLPPGTRMRHRLRQGAILAVLIGLPLYLILRTFMQ